MKIVIELDDDTWVKVLDGYVPLGIGKQLKNGIPIDKFLEDIKREINDLRHENMINFVDSIGVICAVLEIINKHLGKEESK